MQSDTELATRLMAEFAARSGIGTGAVSNRYLWTDAHALMNALELFRATGAPRWRNLAVWLIGDVHDVLGRHRPDSYRRGWLSGLSEEEGARHPTRGGLRIGKPLPERAPEMPYDELTEWDRDGQYWHYLTRWMEALSRAAVILGEPQYQRQAVELAQAAFPRFLKTSSSGAPIGLAWKMSVDLSRPQIGSISPHDALDGYVTFRGLGRGRSETGLAEEPATLLRLSEGQDWSMRDPLGLGGLLQAAVRLALLPDRNARDDGLIAEILVGVEAGLKGLLREGGLNLPAAHRLGFRELGLAIGLQGLSTIDDAAHVSIGLEQAVGPHLAPLRSAVDVGRRIVVFWRGEQKQQTRSWTDHRDINEVMLASALLEASVAPTSVASVP